MADEATDPRRALGWYRGARYTRTWLTMLAGMTLAWFIFFSLASGNSAWMVLIPVAVAVIAPLWLVPLSVIGADGIQLVLKRRWIPWSQVDSVSDPRPGDEEVRLILIDAHSVILPGVTPHAAPALRAFLAQRH